MAKRRKYGNGGKWKAKMPSVWKWQSGVMSKAASEKNSNNNERKLIIIM